MSIIRVHRKPDSFTVVDNRIITDERLSVEALGLLVYLLSKPRQWQVRSEDIKKRFNTGKHKPYTVLQQLQAAGYARWSRDRTGKTTWDIFDEPQPENRDEEPKQALMPLDPYPDNRDEATPNPEKRDEVTGQGFQGKKPHPENREEGATAPHPENRDVLVSTEEVNTDSISNEMEAAPPNLWDVGKGMNIPGSVIGKWIKVNGELRVAECIAAIAVKRPADPVQYGTAWLQERPEKLHVPKGDDQLVPWARKHGFPEPGRTEHYGAYRERLWALVREREGRAAA